MNRTFRTNIVLPFLIWSLVAAPCSAWVMFRTLDKGEVSYYLDKETRQVLLKVPPLGGTEVTGSWDSSTMYYRGTQKSLQELIDGLAQIKENHVTVAIDRSGMPGRIEPTKTYPLPRTIVYQFSVTISRSPRVASAAQTTHVLIRVHTAGGIEADKIIIPKRPEAPLSK